MDSRRSRLHTSGLVAALAALTCGATVGITVPASRQAAATATEPACTTYLSMPANQVSCRDLEPVLQTAIRASAVVVGDASDPIARLRESLALGTFMNGTLVQCRLGVTCDLLALAAFATFGATDPGTDADTVVGSFDGATCGDTPACRATANVVALLSADQRIGTSGPDTLAVIQSALAHLVVGGDPGGLFASIADALSTSEAVVDGVVAPVEDLVSALLYVGMYSYGTPERPIVVSVPRPAWHPQPPEPGSDTEYCEAWFDYSGDISFSKPAFSTMFDTYAVATISGLKHSSYYWSGVTMKECPNPKVDISIAGELWVKTNWGLGPWHLMDSHLSPTQVLDSEFNTRIDLEMHSRQAVQEIHVHLNPIKWVRGKVPLAVDTESYFFAEWYTFNMTHWRFHAPYDAWLGSNSEGDLRFGCFNDSPFTYLITSCDQDLYRDPREAGEIHVRLPSHTST